MALKEQISAEQLQGAGAQELEGAGAGCGSHGRRSEDPEAIIVSIAAGLPATASAQIEPDRALAIALAVRQAAAQDVVLLAGKGHETYQEVGGIRLPFSDRAHAEMALEDYTRLARSAQSAGVRT